MASWKWPAVVNTILSDVPGINTLLNALLKQDPAGTTDVPAGAKRWVDTPEGKQFQNFNGSEWQSVGKLAHDAASVDGHSAATDATPNTIPVRGADGRLPGDIAGTAEKAKEAQKLSETNPIEKGGTGATAAPQARQNLGVPPTNHASAGMDYGIGTESLYGHVKPHDELDVTLTAASGHAFSPAGAASLKDSLESSLAGLADVVEGNAVAQAAKDAEQDAAIVTAQSSADAAKSSADAAQNSADGKVDRAGDSIEWLKFPYGQIFSESDPAIRGTVFEGARGDASSGYGAMIAPRHALAVNNPGGIDLLTRHPDGSFGVMGAMFRDGRWIWKGRNVVFSINGAFADDAGNVQLIEFHSDPLVWWKRYSNGWIEQGGIIYASGNDYDIVTFPIKFQSIPARGDFQMGIRDGAYPAGFYRMTTFADSMTRTTMNVFAKTGDNRIMSVTGFWSAYGF